VTPLDQKLRLAGTMEFGKLDESIDAVRVGAIARAPQSFFRDWGSTVEPEVCAGMQPMSPDGLPLIGQLGDLDRVYVSTGHAMLGLTLAPSSAVAVSGLILHGQRSPTLERFNPDRFRRRSRRRVA
jgi:D-amino-acid dehydrogenase